MNVKISANKFAYKDVIIDTKIKKNERNKMNRRKLFIELIVSIPIALIAKTTQSKFNLRTNKGFKVNSGDARFGVHFKMKGVTLNTLDIKISGDDTNSELAVFEQTGLTPNGGPPMHIHPYQDEWFYIIEEEVLIPGR